MTEWFMAMMPQPQRFVSPVAPALTVAAPCCSVSKTVEKSGYYCFEGAVYLM